MNKRFFSTILSLIIWPFALLGFLICCLSLLLLMTVIPPRRLTPIVRLLCSLVLLSSGIFLRVHGRKNIDPQKSYLWMMNHQSLYDVFIMTALLPQYVVGIEAAHHFHWPIWGWVIKRWGNIPIKRKNLNQAIESITIAKEALKQGTSIIIAPEGTRTLTGKIGPFKKGPFHLAMGAKAEIISVGIHGAFDIKKKYDWRIYPGKVTVNIGKPIPYNDYKKKSLEELMDSIRSEVQLLAGEEVHA